MFDLSRAARERTDPPAGTRLVEYSYLCTVSDWCIFGYFC
jgi:hypothetical protein